MRATDGMTTVVTVDHIKQKIIHGIMSLLDLSSHFHRKERFHCHCNCHTCYCVPGSSDDVNHFGNDSLSGQSKKI